MATKAAKNWQAAKRKWYVANPPNDEDGYNCFYCGRFLFRQEVELDHYRPRSGNPELRFDLGNLRSSCHECNFRKGSIDGDRFLEIIKKKT
jgi:uncharacterized protein (TIGR02646 family)